MEEAKKTAGTRSAGERERILHFLSAWAPAVDVMRAGVEAEKRLIRPDEARLELVRHDLHPGFEVQLNLACAYAILSGIGSEAEQLFYTADAMKHVQLALHLHPKRYEEVAKDATLQILRKRKPQNFDALIADARAIATPKPPEEPPPATKPETKPEPATVGGVVPKLPVTGSVAAEV